MFELQYYAPTSLTVADVIELRQKRGKNDCFHHCPSELELINTSVIKSHVHLLTEDKSQMFIGVSGFSIQCERAHKAVP